MLITLEKAGLNDAAELYRLQIKSFRALLRRYQDYSSSPGAEKPERTIQRLMDPSTDYYFISLQEDRQATHIGALRICNLGELCKLKQIFILPDYQGNGYAQMAIAAAEALYPFCKRWELDTILQEAKLCYLYEKLGYRKTGKVEHVKDGMDIVFYAK